MKIHKSNISSAKPFVTKDSSVIRSITDSANAPVRNVSLAEASLKPGRATIEHFHKETEEIYYFTQGSGLMSLNSREFGVEKGDAVLISPGTRHRVRNTGKGMLKILCACSPPYSHNDTVNTRYNFRLVIFDFDGTLVQSAPSIWATTNAMASLYKLPPVSLKRVESTVGTGLDNFIKGIFADELKKRSMDELINTYRGIYNEKYTYKLKLFAGVRKTLQILKGKGARLAIVSNKLSGSVKKINKELCISEYFDYVLGSENVKKRKPDPYPLTLLMKKCGTNKSETLMVGDSQYDMEAGKRAGCFTFFLTYGYADMNAALGLKPDFTSARFGDITKLF